MWWCFLIKDLMTVLINLKILINLNTFLRTNIKDVSLLSNIYLSKRITGNKKCNLTCFTFKWIYIHGNDKTNSKMTEY